MGVFLPGVQTDPEDVWRALTPLLAQRPVIREARNASPRNRGAYFRKWTRSLTDRLPAVPAAVLVYRADSTTKLLVVDLDVSKGGRAAVQRDAAAVGAMVRRAGGRYISDESPTGGIHLYIPMTDPVDFHDAVSWAKAVARRTPTMDTQPNLNVQEGLIRPPGSAHRLGGHQALHGTLSAAHKVAREGNPKVVWSAMMAELAGDVEAIATEDRQRQQQLAELPDSLPRRGGPKEPSAEYDLIARTGLYDRHGSASQARQAVLVHAVWCGMAITDVMTRIRTGVWPGLAAFYTRYKTPAARISRLQQDWKEAVRYVTATKATKQTQDLVRKSPINEPTTQRGLPSPTKTGHPQKTDPVTERQFLREWRSGLTLLERSRYNGRTAPGIRMVLRAMCEAASIRQTRYIAIGTRWLEIATGMDHTTVAAHLRMLRAEPDPFVRLIENERGDLRADLYELVVPAEVAAAATRRSWPAGKIHALRPVFRELGHPAAFVYEALENNPTGLQALDLAEITGLSRSAVYEALTTLAAYNMVDQSAGGWRVVASTNLRMLAESFGCIDVITKRIEHYRRERVLYRRFLAGVTVTKHNENPYADYPLLWPPEPPPEEEQTAMDLLEQILGAHLIPQ